jgi:hypothetical protein
MKRTFAVLAVGLGIVPSLRAGEKVDYLRDVKPILSRRCYACHGPLHQKSGLRLDTAQRLQTGGEGGPAVVPGHSDESLVIDAITGSEGWRMPPEGEPLSDSEIGTIQTWINQGAEAPPERELPDPRQHWAFRPPVRPSVPQTKNPAWVRNPIDAFLAVEQEARGLKPNPPASPEVLLRRVSLDLTGLAPSPAEVRAFVNDPAPDAYERAVDRLLSSPQYGERWARHWMDVWRYSDWDGYGAEVRESQPHIWRWRDWIVESLNEDKGYDEMVIEMLAADELAPDDPKALRATGFLVRNWYKFNRNVWLENTVEHTAKALLGLTVHCAKCHDHKYDPIAQEDFYRFRAFFEPYQVRTDRVPGKIDTAKDGLTRVYDADAKASTFLFKRGNEASPVKDRPLVPGLPAVLQSRKGFEVKPVSLSRTASYPGLDPTVRATLLADAEVGVEQKLRALREANANLARIHRDLEAQKKASQKDNAPSKEKKETASKPQAAPVDEALAGQMIAVAEAGAAWCARELLAARAHLTCLKAKIAADDSKYAQPPRGDAESLARVASRVERELAYLQADAALVKAENALKFKAKPVAGVKPEPPKKKDEAGEKKRDEAKKALDAALAALSDENATYASLGPVYPATSTGRRLALARWIVSRNNPLAARVAVNHVWMRHFGRPLVERVFDFGLNGKPPTHPALLDWLAVELMERGWSLKTLHRWIVTSNAYRMQSSVRESASANVRLDPENRDLWRMNVRRLEAEAVRDNLLLAAGILDLSQGGPDLDPATGETVRRRSLYFRHAKEKRVMFLRQFDSANVVECYRRSESIVPQQALALANSDLSREAARRLAARLATGCQAESASIDSRFIASAFECVLGRLPTPDERAACEEYLAEQARRLADRSGLTPFGSGPAPAVPPATDPAQRAREDLVHTLFNHNDFVTVR